MNISNFQFSNPVLTKMIFLLNEDFDEKDVPTEELPMTTKVSIGEKNSYSAVVSLQLDIAEQSSSYPFFISTAMSAIFKWDKDVPTETVDSLLKRNAPSLLLGYIRPHIAQISGASPIGTIHVPFMNFLDEQEIK